MNNRYDLLRPGERLDDLQTGGYFLIQDPAKFCFGIDAVLLAAYAKVKRGERAIDLGTGNGIIPILLEAKNEGAGYCGLEIQEESADMARRSVCFNGLEDKIEIRIQRPIVKELIDKLTIPGEEFKITCLIADMNAFIKQKKLADSESTDKEN